jgi:hypothetical protein
MGDIGAVRAPYRINWGLGDSRRADELRKAVDQSADERHG